MARPLRAGRSRSLAGRLYGPGLAAPFRRARVHYGTWGSEPFQALYGPPSDSLSSLTARPAWHAAVLTLAALSVAGIWWSPLLGAVPLLVAALLVSLLPGARAAARSSFMHKHAPRRRRFGMWALTTLLHAVQPLARLRGRAQAPSWRRVETQGAAVPRPRTIRIWSEEWRSAENRLADVEHALRRAGVPVFAAGEFCRWDLHARGGLLGSARLRLGLEEHGAGRQLVRIKISPRIPVTAAVSVAVLLIAAVGADVSGAGAAAALLSVAALVLGGWLARGCAVAVGSFVHEAVPQAQPAPDRARAIPVRET